MITEITQFTNEKVIPIMFENINKDGQKILQVTDDQVNAVVTAIKVMDMMAEVKILEDK